MEFQGEEGEGLENNNANSLSGVVKYDGEDGNCPEHFNRRTALR